VRDLAPIARDATAIVVDAQGALVGALGPRQIAAALADASGNPRYGDVMVPLQSLSVFPARTPAIAVLSELAKHGFAVVRDDAGLGVVEADDVGRQIQIWAMLEERGRSRLATGGRPDDRGQSEDE
jgi:hypothetical protein